MDKAKALAQYSDLLAFLKKQGPLAVAFSGGVDSTLLVYAAFQALGTNMLAISINTPYIPDWELDEALEFAQQHGIPHTIVDVDIPDVIKHNPSDRCYHCKSVLFKTLLKHAQLKRIETIVEGSNKDDLGDYRPGMKALKELKIVSPLLELGLGKHDIRALSKHLNLPTWNKPAYACLLTRIPYDTEITPQEIQRIQGAETVIRKLNIQGSRVRSHGTIARIEVPPSSFSILMQDTIRLQLIEDIKACGYLYVTLDLEGYSTGSLNRTIAHE